MFRNVAVQHQPKWILVLPLNKLDVLDAMLGQVGRVGNSAKGIGHLRRKQIQSAVDAGADAGQNDTCIVLEPSVPPSTDGMTVVMSNVPSSMQSNSKMSTQLIQRRATIESKPLTTF